MGRGEWALCKLGPLFLHPPWHKVLVPLRGARGSHELTEEQRVPSFPFLRWEFLRHCTFFVAVKFDDFPPDDTRVQYFLEALNNFTSGE